MKILLYIILILFVNISFSCRVFQITFWHEQLEPSEQSQKCDYWKTIYESSTNEEKEHANEWIKQRCN